MPTHTAKKNKIAGSKAANIIWLYGIPVNSTITNAPAPIKGGMICPPDEATASTDAANLLGYFNFIIAGKVTIPVEATFADAEPDIEPKSADDITETLAAPPFNLPANAVAIFINPEPASPEFKKDPKITKIDTIDTETPVKGPHIPPSAIVKVPKKLFIGMPGWPNSPGIKFPKTPYKIAKKLTNGNGQPTERLAISNTINNKIIAIKNWPQPSKKPYWSINISWLKDIHKQQKTPTSTTSELIKFSDSVLLYKKIQGRIKAIWIGLEIRLGTKPEKIKKMWNAIEINPKANHIFLFNGICN